MLRKLFEPLLQLNCNESLLHKKEIYSFYIEVCYVRVLWQPAHSSWFQYTFLLTIIKLYIYSGVNSLLYVSDGERHTGSQ